MIRATATVGLVGQPLVWHLPTGGGKPRGLDREAGCDPARCLSISLCVYRNIRLAYSGRAEGKGIFPVCVCVGYVWGCMCAGYKCCALEDDHGTRNGLQQKWPLRFLSTHRL